MPPFALAADVVGDFAQGQIGPKIGIAPERGAEDQQRAAFADFLGQSGQFLRPQCLRGDIKEVAFGRMALLPIDAIARRVGEAFQLARSPAPASRRHILAGDNLPAPFVLFEQRGREFIIAETAAALPIDRLADPALIAAVDNLLQARNDMRGAVIA